MLNLTDADILQLIVFSYMDLSDKKKQEDYERDVAALIEKGRTISDVDVPQVEDGGWIDTEGFIKNQRRIVRNPSIKDLRIIGHINDNSKEGYTGTGLVAYALLNIDRNQIYILCRGSEGGLFHFVPNWIDMIKRREFTQIFKAEDWRDNFNMVFEDSKAFPPLITFVEDIRRKYNRPGMEFYAFGHSKGGGQAIYLSANYGMGGVAIDGVGLAPVTLYARKGYAKTLKNARFVNKIAANDIVGILLMHPEKTVKVKMHQSFELDNGETVYPREPYGFAWAHYPQAIYLNHQGMSRQSFGLHLIPLLISIINRFFMLKLMLDQMTGKEKAANMAALEEIEKQCVSLMSKLSPEE